MSQVSGISGASSENPFGDRNTLNELDMDDFLGLMIAELQNQDPLNPLENADLVAQIGQIREVGATDKLTTTLDSVLLGQNVSSATSLIGQEVRALSDNDEIISGVVNRITIKDGQPEIHIDAVTKAEASYEDGELEAGVYKYKVVYDSPNGGKAAIELGPIATTAVDGLDSSILISNLPETEGVKQIYRTNGNGSEDYHLLDVISNGKSATYVDSASNSKLAEATLSFATTKEIGARKFSAKLSNVSEIRKTTGE